MSEKAIFYIDFSVGVYGDKKQRFTDFNESLTTCTDCISKLIGGEIFSEIFGDEP